MYEIGLPFLEVEWNVNQVADAISPIKFLSGQITVDGVVGSQRSNAVYNDMIQFFHNEFLLSKRPMMLSMK